MKKVLRICQIIILTGIIFCLLQMKTKSQINYDVSLRTIKVNNFISSIDSIIKIYKNYLFNKIKITEKKPEGLEIETYYNYVSEEWIPTSKQENQYDNRGNQICTTNYKYNNGFWLPLKKDNWGYDLNDSLIYWENSIWMNNDWKNQHQGNYFYLNNEIDSAVFQEWENGNWINTESYAYYYDKYLNKTKSVLYLWSDKKGWIVNKVINKKFNTENKQIEYVSFIIIDDSLCNSHKEIYNYENNNLMSHIIFTIDGSYNWMFSKKYFYIYDSLNRMTEKIYEQYDQGSDLDYTTKSIFIFHDELHSMEEYGYNYDTVWNLGWRDVYNYDINGNLLELIQQVYYGIDDWLNLNKIMFTYNKDNKILSRTDYEDYNNYKEWIEVHRSLYTYDPEGYQIQLLYQYWIDNEWQNSGKLVTEYQVTGVSRKNLLLLDEYELFPNPASEFTEINVGANSSSPVRNHFIQIYNIYSEQLFEQSTRLNRDNLPLRIDVSSFPNGIYFIRIAENIQKLVVLR